MMQFSYNKLTEERNSVKGYLTIDIIA